MQPTAKDYAEEAKWRKALEPIIREQIAREIEAKICYDFHCEPDEQEVCNVMRLSLLDATSIARGEK